MPQLSTLLEWIGQQGEVPTQAATEVAWEFAHIVRNEDARYRNIKGRSQCISPSPKELCDGVPCLVERRAGQGASLREQMHPATRPLGLPPPEAPVRGELTDQWPASSVRVAGRMPSPTLAIYLR